MDGYLTPLLGLLLTACGAWQTYMSFASLSWISAYGRIVKREIKRDSKNIFSVNVEIFYEFKVDDYNYVSSNIKPGIATISKFAIPFMNKDRFVGDKYKEGAQVNVQYDVRNPRRCAIEDADFVVPILLFIAGVLVVGLWALNQQGINIFAA